jgi:hypothetical protein
MVTPAGDLITDSGAEDPNTPAEWDGWVSPSKMRNHVLGTPICDWLERMRDRVDPANLPSDWVGDATTVSGYNATLDFTAQIFAKGDEFEQEVWDYLQSRFDCVQILNSYTETNLLSKAIETLEAMRAGREIIYQGVLRDPTTRIFGSPDFLVRADVLPRIIELSGSLDGYTLLDDDLDDNAPELNNPQDLGDENTGWHYRIVDAKVSTVPIGSRNNTLNANKYYNTQLAAYTLGLEAMQGFAPPFAYILARGYKYGSMSTSNCFGLLAPVAASEFVDNATAAAGWIREMRTNGFSGLGLGPHTPLWNANTPTPSHSNLRIDFSKDHGQWQSAGKYLATVQNELTLMPSITAAHRNTLLSATTPSISDGWRDSNFSLSSRASAKQRVVFDANRLTTPAILPAQGTTPAPTYPATFRTPASTLEFFVDYESVQGLLREDFSTFPNKGDDFECQYMIGCGYSLNRVWQEFQCFVVSDLTQSAEEEIFRQWFEYMDDVCNRHGVTPNSAQMIHWSDFERSRNTSARERAGNPDWWPPSSPTQSQISKGVAVPPNALNLWDMKTELIDTVPFGVTGAYRWGIKEFSKSMAAVPAASGSINLWPSPSPVEHGQSASLAPLPAARAGTTLNIRDSADPSKFADPLIEASRVYNEVDCEIMFDILEYLRSNH